MWRAYSELNNGVHKSKTTEVLNVKIVRQKFEFTSPTPALLCQIRKGVKQRLGALQWFVSLLPM